MFQGHIKYQAVLRLIIKPWFWNKQLKKVSMEKKKNQMHLKL